MKMRTHLTNDQELDYCISWYAEENLYDITLTSVVVEASKNSKHWEKLVHFYIEKDILLEIDEFFLNGRNFEETKDFVYNLSKRRSSVDYTKYTKGFSDTTGSRQGQTLF